MELGSPTKSKAKTSVVNCFAMPKHLRARQNLEQILREHPEFWVELQAVAARLKTHPAWLLNVMASESLFVAGARNRLPGQTASGLLQIIEDTAQGLGTTTAAIRQMSPVEQLRFVEKYFAPFRGRLDSLADVYTATFRGFILEGGAAAVVAPLDDSRKEQRIYALNQALDLNGDGRIPQPSCCNRQYREPVKLRLKSLCGNPLRYVELQLAI